MHPFYLINIRLLLSCGSLFYCYFNLFSHFLNYFVKKYTSYYNNPYLCFIINQIKYLKMSSVLTGTRSDVKNFCDCGRHSSYHCRINGENHFYCKNNIRAYHDALKLKGVPSHEIRVLIDIKIHGVMMTKAIYLFNELYNKGEIDGFPQSSIEVLEKIFGKSSIKNNKEYKLVDRVITLQKTITDSIDLDCIYESVRYYLS